MDLSIISRTGGPVLLWRGPDYDSLDLTGPVVANWVNKGVGLFGDYDLGPDFTLFAPMPEGLHWRELVAILSVLLAGGRVVLASGDASTAGTDASTAGTTAAPPDGDFFALVPFGHESAENLVDAEEIFVFNPPALALSTPVDEDFIDVNSAIRAYPDVTPRRLAATGTLEIDGENIDWTNIGASAAPGADGSAAGPGRPAGILVSKSTPRPDQWAAFLNHLLGGGEILLANGIDDARLVDLADSLGEVRGRLGAWTK
ncbi:hypothetical protein [Brevibacterium sp. ZH18]|uniref:hypothetical protein n=1 Tax=Brevibacterium sp. ZH18 TaxID=2927784 RepID=UPI001F62007A|nr:hypothetical protein [Brevibacterium sp. ZH18]MCI4011307.1 hypothetical protein [Brevibacterium sp. ZH18]